MPIYEYRCEACAERFEELLSSSDKPAPPCPKCGSANVVRVYSPFSTEWMPSDVKWNRFGSTF